MRARSARIRKKWDTITGSAGHALGDEAIKTKARPLGCNSVQTFVATKWCLSHPHPTIAGEWSLSRNCSSNVALWQGLGANCAHGLSGELEG